MAQEGGKVTMIHTFYLLQHIAISSVLTAYRQTSYEFMHCWLCTVLHSFGNQTIYFY